MRNQVMGECLMKKSGLDEVIYVFQQYYQDVPVDGKVRLLVSDKIQTINSWMIQIPDNFDAHTGKELSRGSTIVS